MCHTLPGRLAAYWPVFPVLCSSDSSRLPILRCVSPVSLTLFCLASLPLLPLLPLVSLVSLVFCLDSRCSRLFRTSLLSPFLLTCAPGMCKVRLVCGLPRRRFRCCSRSLCHCSFFIKEKDDGKKTQLRTGERRENTTGSERMVLVLFQWPHKRSIVQGKA